MARFSLLPAPGSLSPLLSLLFIPISKKDLYFWSSHVFLVFLFFFFFFLLRLHPSEELFVEIFTFAPPPPSCPLGDKSPICSSHHREARLCVSDGLTLPAPSPHLPFFRLQSPPFLPSALACFFWLGCGQSSQVLGHPYGAAFGCLFLYVTSFFMTQRWRFHSLPSLPICLEKFFHFT